MKIVEITFRIDSQVYLYMILKFRKKSQICFYGQLLVYNYIVKCSMKNHLKLHSTLIYLDPTHNRSNFHYFLYFLS